MKLSEFCRIKWERARYSGRIYRPLEDVLKDHPDNVKLIGILKGAVKQASAKSTENR